MSFDWQAFEVDEDAPEYRALHPNKQKSKNLVAEHFDPVSDDENERDSESGDGDSDASSSSADEGERRSSKNKRQRVSEKPAVAEKKQKSSAPRLESTPFNSNTSTNQSFTCLFGFLLCKTSGIRVLKMTSSWTILYLTRFIQ